jgi:hypothetical protein
MEAQQRKSSLTFKTELGLTQEEVVREILNICKKNKISVEEFVKYQQNKITRKTVGRPMEKKVPKSKVLISCLPEDVEKIKEFAKSLKK